MEYLKNIAIIKDKLASLLDGYIREFRSNGDGFQDFSDEAIMYALLEYSRFPRPLSKEQRIVYIHGKCLEYEGKPHVYVTVEFDEQYNCFIVLCPDLYKPKPTDLPF